MKLKIKKGDIVKVTTGDHKGQSGKVLQVLREKNRVLVEGVNKVSKHTKPNAKNTQGGIEKIESPIHISNVVVLINDKPTKIGRRLNEQGKIVRYSKLTGEEIK
jgi:large subunit ribosomal protein L24